MSNDQTPQNLENQNVAQTGPQPNQPNNQPINNAPNQGSPQRPAENQNTGTPNPPMPTPQEIADKILKQNKILRNKERFSFPPGSKIPESVLKTFAEYDETNMDIQEAELYAYKDAQYQRDGRL